MKIPRTKVESSQIRSIGYDPATKTLDVEFENHIPGNPPSVYRYANVPPKLQSQLMAAESIGKFFGANIRKHPDKYPHRKLTAEEL